MTIDLDNLAARILADERVRERVARDLGVEDGVRGAEHLIQLLREHAAPRGAGTSLPTGLDNGDVFREAVTTLAGSGRPRALVRRAMPELEPLLHGFDPVCAHRAALYGGVSTADLQVHLPGQSGPGDARAMLRWARLLCETPDYPGFLAALADAFVALARVQLDDALTPAELHLCIVGYLGNPPGRWAGCGHLARRMDPRSLKAPGMGYMLTAEFLRRLGWDGFRVDGHVQRLLERWAPGAIAEQAPAAERLMSLVGRSDRLIRGYLMTSLAGTALLPPGVPPHQADLLLALVGAHVERPGTGAADASGDAAA